MNKGTISGLSTQTIIFGIVGLILLVILVIVYIRFQKKNESSGAGTLTYSSKCKADNYTLKSYFDHINGYSLWFANDSWWKTQPVSAAHVEIFKATARDKGITVEQLKDCWNSIPERGVNFGLQPGPIARHIPFPYY